MTHTQRYAEATFPERVWILGRPLQPSCCIGHALLLHRIGSPFVTGHGPEATDEVGMGDLLLALYVCSRPWREAAVGIDKRRTRWLLKCWGWQLRRSNTDAAILRAELQLRDYITQAWDGPDFWEEQERKGARRKSGAPVLASLKAMLCGTFGYSEERALATPIRVALFDTAAWAETQGAIQWVSDGDLADIDEALRRVATN